jgi:hypothetical protein
MPDFPPIANAPRETGRAYTMQLLAAGGDLATVSLDGIATSVTGAELATLREKIGAATNAAMLQTTQSEIVSVAKSRVNPLDESYSSAATKLLLTFQADDLTVRTVAIPAPDESLFGTDGISIVPPDAAAAAGTGPKIMADLISNLRVVLNGGIAGTGTYQFLTGYRTERSRKLAKPRQARPSIEPAGVLPPAAPGT